MLCGLNRLFCSSLVGKPGCRRFSGVLPLFAPAWSAFDNRKPAGTDNGMLPPAEQL